MLNSKISKKISIAENGLIKVIRHLQFGTIYGVEVPAEELKLISDLTIEEIDLVHFAREHPYIDVLTIHAGKPATAEVDFVDEGFRCRKKHKFPTV